MAATFGKSRPLNAKKLQAAARGAGQVGQDDRPKKKRKRFAKELKKLSKLGGKAK